MKVPRYPPDRQGLPVVPAVKLLDTQRELLRGIANHAIVTPEIHQRFYLPTIERFAAFVHLLPASESHHHRGAGGLLRHSLEVGLWALQSADKLLLDAARTPAIRREMEPRWQLAVFFAALCHDVGKPVTDLVVTNREGTTVWNPLKDNLDSWAVRSGIDAYFLQWVQGRSRQHTVLAALIADRIIGNEVLVWIGEGGMNFIVWMLESFNNNPGAANPIHELVVRADQTSVERDLKTFGAATTENGLGIPVERHLTNLMRRFVQEGVWRINEPGARLWNIQEKLYLIWPLAGDELVRQIREDNIPGLPRTADALLDMMVERRMALLRPGSTSEEQFWQIAPACLAEKISTICLTAIQLPETALTLPDPPSSVEGTIVNQNQACVPKPAEEFPPIVAPETLLPDTASTCQDVFLLDDAVGDAMRQLAQDLRCGKKQWGIDAVLSPEGHVLLHWPQVFDGSELAPHRILGELSDRNFLWIDPMTPLKKIQEVEIGDRRIKVIRLRKEFADQVFPDAERSVDIAPDPAASSVTPDNAPKRFERAAQGRFHPAGTDSVESSQSPPQKTSTGVSLDAIISVLSKHPTVVQADGWRTLPKFEALGACRQSGIRLTHARLGKLGRMEPNRFVVEGIAVKFRS